jgi:hypothetical protein
MRITKKPKQASIGLLAIGTSGPWEVSIDETTSRPVRWFVGLEGPSLSFHFEISALQVVGRMLHFLAADRKASRLNGKGARGARLVLNSESLMTVTIIKDDEYSDRFFLVAGGVKSPALRLTFAGKDAGHFIEALRQIEEELSASDAQ